MGRSGRGEPASLLWILGATVCTLGVMFGVAAIFVDDFRGDGAAIVAAILGPIATLAGVLYGAAFAKNKMENGGGGDG